MRPEQILQVCLACRRVKNYPGDWRESLPHDLTHPAQSHGYCSEACAQVHYPPVQS